jgi:DNA-binding NtrC family response regulator
MPKSTLQDCRILVVEDEYMLADELQNEFVDANAVVLGPVGTLNNAMNLIASEQHIDGAVLDVSLDGEMVFPAADLLLQRGVPFVFTTGYDASSIPPRFKHIVRCDKPVNIRKVTQALGRAVHPI